MSTIEPQIKSYLSKSSLIKGLISALLLSFLLILLIALLLQVTSLSESYLNTLASMVLVISVFGGGITAAKGAEARFIFNGLGVSLLYLLVILAITILGGSPIHLASLWMKILYCVGAGIMGGMLGAVLK